MTPLSPDILTAARVVDPSFSFIVPDAGKTSPSAPSGPGSESNQADVLHVNFKGLLYPV